MIKSDSSEYKRILNIEITLNEESPTLDNTIIGSSFYISNKTEKQCYVTANGKKTTIKKAEINK